MINIDHIFGTDIVGDCMGPRLRPFARRYGPENSHENDLAGYFQGATDSPCGNPSH